LYVYLTMIRHMEEQPRLVRIALYMARQNVNFYAAVLFASAYACSNSNHNFVADSIYSNRCNTAIGDCRVSLNTIIALRRFVNDFMLYRKGPLMPPLRGLFRNTGLL